MTQIADKNFIDTVVELVDKNKIAFAGKDIINIYSHNTNNVMITMVFEPLQFTCQTNITVDRIVVYTDEFFIDFIVEPESGKMLYDKAVAKIKNQHSVKIEQFVRSANREPIK